VNNCVYLLGLSDLCAVTETLVVFLHLFALLISIATSYGFYLFTASLFSPELAAKMNGTKTIDLITLAILIGGLSSSMSLGAAMGAFILTYHLGRRYRASLLAQIIVSLPGVQFIPYVHRKYWLPSGASLRPRPRSFYLKRLLIRQSGLSPIFQDLHLLNSVSYRY
jgi:hypothetical protein